MATTHNHAVTGGADAERLPSSRLAPAGRAGTDAVGWAGRITGAVLAVALVWFVYALVRPLPAPPPGEALRVPRAPASLERGLALDVRESRLASLGSANFFSHDRMFWEGGAQEQDAVAEAERLERAAEEQAAELERLNSVTRRRNPDEPLAFNEIPITESSKIPVALLQRIQEVQLRGVYRGEGDSVAMIDLMTEREPRNRMRRLRVGQRFDDDNWRLLAIDEKSDRVILSRGGHNFMISLYDSPFGREGALAQATDDEDPALDSRGEEEVRAELADAGLEESEIDALLALALGDDALEGEPEDEEADEAVAAGAEEADGPDAGRQPTRPPGVATILRLLSANPLQDSDSDTGGSRSDGEGGGGPDGE